MTYEIVSCSDDCTVRVWGMGGEAMFVHEALHSMRCHMVAMLPLMISSIPATMVL